MHQENEGRAQDVPRPVRRLHLSAPRKRNILIQTLRDDPLILVIVAAAGIATVIGVAASVLDLALLLWGPK